MIWSIVEARFGCREKCVWSALSRVIDFTLPFFRWVAKYVHWGEMWCYQNFITKITILQNISLQNFWIEIFYQTSYFLKIKFFFLIHYNHPNTFCNKVKVILHLNNTISLLFTWHLIFIYNTTNVFKQAKKKYKLF